MKIFVFGNEYIENDSLAKKLDLKIEGVEFIDCKSASDLFNANEKNPVILDVVEGIKKPMLISIDQLQEVKSVTAHDMDLSFQLKLYKELGTIKDATIIGIPMNEVNKEELIDLIQTQLTFKK